MESHPASRLDRIDHLQALEVRLVDEVRQVETTQRMKANRTMGDEPLEEGAPMPLFLPIEAIQPEPGANPEVVMEDGGC